MAGESTLTTNAAASVQRGRGHAAHALRVLVAEDHPVNQRLVAEILRERGHQAVLAASGLEALALLERQPFDVILMDGQMPEMDGYAATREIRRREAQAGSSVRMPIIAVTAHVGSQQRQACLDAGMDDYVAKPIDPDLLLDCLESAAGLHRKVAVERLLAAAGPDAGNGHPGPAGLANPAPEAARPAADNVGVAASPAVFNRSAALERVRGRQVFLRQLNTMFLAELPNVMDAIGTAAARNDAVELEALAHRLRGAAITVGGEALAAAAGALEKVAGQRLLNEVPTLFARLYMQAGQLCSALREFALESPAAPTP